MDKNLRLSIILQAAGNVVGFLRNVKGASDRTTTALNAARQRVQELQRTTKDVGAFRAMETRLNSTRGALAEAQVEAQRLARAHAAAERPTKAMTRGFEVARLKVRELQAQEQGQIRTLQDLRGRLESAGVSTRNLAGHEVRLTREIREANSALTDQVRRMEQVGQRQRQMADARRRYDRTQHLAGSAQGAGASAIGAGIAAGAPLFVAGGEGVNFEDAMLDVKKVVDFETPQQFTELRADVLDLSIALNQPAEGMAAIFAAAGQAKIARGELRGFATDAGMMGVAFDSTADEAGKSMATWRTAFGMTQTQVRGLADQINYLGDNGNATALQISDVVTRVGPLAGVAGAAAGEVAALGSTMVAMGVQEEIAATGIKNTMLALTKGTAATKAQRTAFQALGLDAERVSKSMQMDAGGTIVDVMERVSRLRPDQQTAILTQLFGSESVAAIAPMLSQLTVLKGNLDAVGDSSLYAGSMQREFENRQSGAKTAAQQMLKGVKAVAIEVGTAFLPQIKAGSAALRGFAGGVREFAVAHPGAIRVAGVLLALVAGGLIIFGGLAMAVAAVLGPFALLQLAMTQTGLLFGPMIAGLVGTGSAAGGAAIGINAMLWPVLAVVAAVAALAAVAFLVVRNWGTIGPWFGKLWNGLTGLIQSGMQLITGYVMNFTPLGFMIRNWGPLTNFFGALWGWVGSIVGLGLDYLRLALLNFTPLGLILRNWEPISGYVGNLWSTVSTMVSAGIAGIKAAIAGFQPLNDFKAAFAGVWTFLQGLPGRLLNAGADAMRGFTRGIRGQRAAVQAAAADAAGRAETGTRTRLDTHSPSRVFDAIGRDVMSGFALGIHRGAGDPVARMRAAAAALTSAGTLALAGGATALEFDTGPRIQQRPPAAAAAAGQGGSSTPSIGSLTIQIFQQPGESMDELARKVADIIQRPALAAYADDRDSYGEA